MRRISTANATEVACTTAGLLLSIICLVHGFVLLCYALKWSVSAWTFPLAIITAIGINFLIQKSRNQQKVFWIATLITCILLIISLTLSWFYFDLSWDGQWYQQAAVYDLGGKWNPLFHPLETPDKSNHTSILHFPKSYWYFGAALLKLFGSVELGKAYNWIALFAAFNVVYTLCIDLKLTVIRSVLLSLFVVLNPVVWSEITTYLNDGDLYLFWAIYVASIILWIRNNTRRDYLWVAGMAAICLANVKFTGLVFLLASSFFLFTYIIVIKRTYTKRFLISHAGIVMIAVLLFGFNPYVTNTIKRGHPFYPIMGTKEFPSVYEQSGQDDNEVYETPQNMRGKTMPVRLLYANFSQPGNAPYNGEDSARLVFPFTTNPATLRAYEFHETRSAGFGPFFGILLLLTIPVVIVQVMQFSKYSLPAFIFLTGIYVCLSLSIHFWWPRFFPILWILPIVALLMFWSNAAVPPTRLQRIYSWLLTVIIAANALIVAAVHMKWETASSVELRKQLQHMSDRKQSIKIDYGWFGRSVEEKLMHWSIPFTPGTVPDSVRQKLPSVVEGYPNQVFYSIE